MLSTDEVRQVQETENVIKQVLASGTDFNNSETDDGVHWSPERRYGRQEVNEPTKADVISELNLPMTNRTRARS